MRENIGLFGGTFDPPHLGHLILAGEALDQLALSRLLWVLTPTPPHKLEQEITPLEHRFAMVQLALKDWPQFQFSTVEIDRPGPHYMLDTVNIIRDQFPDADVTLLIGGDSLRELPTWHRPRDLALACRYFGVMRRPRDEIDLGTLENEIPGITKNVHFVDAPLLEIASSDIRQRAARGRAFRHYLQPAVYEYIIEKSLYKADFK
jgi:nicotinate-nucleotide adenylyltransferase